MRDFSFRNVVLGLAVTIGITACSDNIGKMQAEYNLKCFGDDLASCKHMLIDLQEAKMKLEYEKALKKLDGADVPDEVYEKLENLYEAELQKMEDVRPGWFITLIDGRVERKIYE